MSNSVASLLLLFLPRGLIDLGVQMVPDGNFAGSDCAMSRNFRQFSALDRVFRPQRMIFAGKFGSVNFTSFPLYGCHSRVLDHAVDGLDPVGSLPRSTGEYGWQVIRLNKRFHESHLVDAHFQEETRESERTLGKDARVWPEY